MSRGLGFKISLWESWDRVKTCADCTSPVNLTVHVFVWPSKTRPQWEPALQSYIVLYMQHSVHTDSYHSHFTPDCICKLQSGKHVWSSLVEIVNFSIDEEHRRSSSLLWASEEARKAIETQTLIIPNQTEVLRIGFDWGAWSTKGVFKE